MTLDAAIHNIELACAFVPVKTFAEREALVDSIRILRAALTERQALLDSRPSGAAQPTSTPPAN